MKKFFAAIACFVILPIVVLSVALPAEWHIFKKSLVAPGKIVGVIGDSHSACAIDPSVFPECANYSQRNGLTVVSLAKIDMILKSNPEMRYFLLELAPSTVLGTSSAFERAKSCLRYQPSVIMLQIFETEKMGGFPNENVVRSYLSGVVEPFLMRPFSGTAYSPLNEGFVPIDRRVDQSHWWKEGGKFVRSMEMPQPLEQCESLKEVRMIMDRCKVNLVKPILLTTPLLKGYIGDGVSMSVFAQFKLIVSNLCREYNTVWIDCIEDSPDPSDWADHAHLNATGARKFTEFKLRPKFFDVLHKMTNEPVETKYEK